MAGGGLVLGSCNGFQILCEAGLLPGALMRNECLQYRCQTVHLRVENADTVFTRTCREGQVLTMPISHGEGRYYADPDTLRTAARLGADRVSLRYRRRTTRALDAIPTDRWAPSPGVVNESGTVLGLMPHPERAAEVDAWRS